MPKCGLYKRGSLLSLRRMPGRVPGFGREARVVVGLCPRAFELLRGLLVETYFFPRCLLTLQGSRGDSLG